MGVALGDLDVAVTCELLRKFEIARTTQDRCHKVMPERMGRDLASRVFTENFTHAICDDVAPGGSCDRLDLFAGAFVVTGEQWQGRAYFLLNISS